MKAKTMLLAGFAAAAIVGAVLISKSILKPPSSMSDKSIGFTDALEAEAHVKSQRELRMTTEPLWDQYSDEKTGKYWMVFRKDSPFYPSVVVREPIIKPTGLEVKFSFVCNASPDQCATLKSYLQRD